MRYFYGKGNMMPYLGSESFRAWAYSQRVTGDESITTRERLRFMPSAKDIVKNIA
ncbi:MAG: hypothetical protein ACI9Y1_003634 [Lentisphaeria bacterium]|jgi:hypothetical protein